MISRQVASGPVCPKIIVGLNYSWFNEVLDSEDDVREVVLNRARLYRDRRDFVIQDGDAGMWYDYSANPAVRHGSNTRRADDTGG